MEARYGGHAQQDFQAGLVRLHRYGSKDEYVSVQGEWNRRKIDLVWATEEALSIVARSVSESIPDAKFGVCHGSRNGWEQKRLKALLGITVVGTDISDTAALFPDTIRWDFHDPNPDWTGRVDFVYSNSLDHSYDPDLALRVWMESLSPRGLCFIDWSDGHGESHVNPLDCFGASSREMVDILGKHGVVESMPVEDNHLGHVIFVVRGRT